MSAQPPLARPSRSPRRRNPELVPNQASKPQNAPNQSPSKKARSVSPSSLAAQARVDAPPKRPSANIPADTIKFFGIIHALAGLNRAPPPLRAAEEASLLSQARALLLLPVTATEGVHVGVAFTAEQAATGGLSAPPGNDGPPRKPPHAGSFSSLWNGALPVMHAAICARLLPLVRLLLELAPNSLTTQSSEEDSPLHLAADGGDRDIVAALLSSGARVDAREHNTMTPLHLAAAEGHDEVVALLLSAGSMVDAVDIDSMTPLHHAAANNADSVVDLLCRAGADVNAKDHNDVRPLHLAAAGGIGDALEVLLEQDGVEIEAADVEGMTALHAAAQAGHGVCIKMLVEHEANVNAECGELLTPLHYAAVEGHAGAIMALVTAGADVEAEDDDGCTALHRAALENEPKVIRALVAAGAALEERTAEDETALHLAVLEGHVDVVRELLDAGADCTCKLHGETPLMLTESDEILQLLRVAEAEQRRRGWFGKLWTWFGWGTPRAQYRAQESVEMALQS